MTTDPTAKVVAALLACRAGLTCGGDLTDVLAAVEQVRGEPLSAEIAALMDRAEAAVLAFRAGAVPAGSPHRRVAIAVDGVLTRLGHHRHYKSTEEPAPEPKQITTRQENSMTAHTRTRALAAGCLAAVLAATAALTLNPGRTDAQAQPPPAREQRLATVLDAMFTQIDARYAVTVMGRPRDCRSAAPDVEGDEAWRCTLLDSNLQRRRYRITIGGPGDPSWFAAPVGPGPGTRPQAAGQVRPGRAAGDGCRVARRWSAMKLPRLRRPKLPPRPDVIRIRARRVPAEDREAVAARAERLAKTVRAGHPVTGPLDCKYVEGVLLWERDRREQDRLDRGGRP